MAKTSTVLITFAGILGPIALVSLAISFSTDHWLEYKVNLKTNSSLFNRKDELKFKKILYARIRGLFRECYLGPVMFDPNTPGLTDEYCLEISYKVPDIDQSAYSLEYWQRIHLMRTQLAFMVIALLCYLLAYVFGIVVCCARSSKWALLSTVFTYTTAFGMALAMACFHGIEYLERNKIVKQPGDIIFQRDWPSEITKATAKSYGYSYALGWVSMILAAIAGTLYALAAWSLKSERYGDKAMVDSKSNLSTFSYPNFPIAQPAPDNFYNPYEPKILYHYPEKRGKPAVAYENGGQDMWHWAN